MMRQQFALNDGSRPWLLVVSQDHRKIGGLTIQISKTLFCYIGEAPVYRYVYEEINDMDMVVYARYMGEDNIKAHYKWAV